MTYNKVYHKYYKTKMFIKHFKSNDYNTLLLIQNSREHYNNSDSEWTGETLLFL